MPSACVETSLDGFLGGRLVLEQPLQGYRAGTDPVLLAASVPARAGQSCLDLGCGVGAVALCLMARTGAACTGVELQPGYAALARANASRNDLPLEVIEGDATDLPPDLRQRSFDHVFFNPPYFAAEASTAPADAGRDLALRDRGDLTDWLAAAVRRTRPRGTVTLIARTDRLPEVMAAVPRVLGSLRLQPLVARAGRPAKRFVLQGIKEGRAPFTLRAPLVLHDGSRHLRDGEDGSDIARHLLREGGALSLSDPAC
ncbi:methyltransferase domain-containing protein [Dinoroseobacter sp. PD6]|uniref:tRNA1(Val) (adenine(37)-N6)-methyltransferase n=1 Tax=Dinoroseobacter sp. PD6 TaxID=3028384 RepID=UPI00237BD3AD|nr:methyltransferase domain-containing protein [Dinoroseobacter sp. PD6]MDD9716753.1 methyltransferase domain-containing protein [Dinoroseobacter sp. PD6]